MNLRAESETARLSREAEQHTIVALRNELKNEQLSLQYERQRLEYDVKQREKRVLNKNTCGDYLDIRSGIHRKTP